MKEKKKKYLSPFWENICNEKSHWSKINFYFNTAILRFFLSWFLIAPAAVAILSQLPDQIGFTHNSIDYSVELKLPFTWWLLWWASLFYTIAYAISAWGSPPFVTNYPKYSKYEEFGHSPRWLVWEIYYAYKALDTVQNAKLTERLISKKIAVETHVVKAGVDGFLNKPIIRENGTFWQFLKEGKTYEIEIDENLDFNKVRDIFWEIQARYAASKSSLRWTSLFCLLISSILVIVVVGQNILTVLCFI